MTDPPLLRDPELPGLELALERDWLAVAVSRALRHGTGGAWQVEESDFVRFRYRPGTRAVVQLRLRLCGPAGRRELPAALWLFSGGKAAKHGAGLPAPAAGELPAGLFEPVTGGLLTLFPHDRHLPEIARFLAAPERHAAALGVAGDAALPEVTRYRPGIGATFRWAGPEEAAYVKIGGARPPAATVARIARLAERCAVSGLAPALPLGTDPSIAAMALEAAPGEPLNVLLGQAGDAEVAATMARIGSALARFHRLEPALGSDPEPPDSASLLRRAETIATFIGLVDPALGEAARRLQRKLSATVMPLAAGLCHLDMKAEHILVSPDRIRLIDVDDAGRGDPISDLAMLEMRFLARPGRLLHP